MSKQKGEKRGTNSPTFFKQKNQGKVKELLIRKVAKQQMLRPKRVGLHRLLYQAINC
ncbi:hypothetical protein DPMN_113763 [Dreissena polymorpha]|uniref:Uncharacterized protein n=1 Tax=Dreissena polymorpha TaxID=45954 RepID=A0A9D4QQZ1_DREPO|nr:hypothetical protein DPMN_113763 [Dreissena polymorpha]